MDKATLKLVWQGVNHQGPPPTKGANSTLDHLRKQPNQELKAPTDTLPLNASRNYHQKPDWGGRR